MDFEENLEQGQLRSAVEQFMRRECPAQKVRQWDRDGTFPEEC